jgi:GlpG protein
MRLIGQLESETHAQRFGDFLYSEGIESHVEQKADGAYEIWVLDEDAMDTATSLLNAYVTQTDAPQFVKAAQAGAKQRDRDRKQAIPKRAKIVDGRTLFYKPPVPYGVLTMALMAISVGVTILTGMGANARPTAMLSVTEYGEDGDYIVWDGSLPEIRHGQVWRLFTPMFLHFSIIHILFNMLWLRDLGSMIEARKSPGLLLVLVLTIAAISNLAQFQVSGPMFGGMSGVVYGLLGYVWMQGRFNPASGLALQKQTVTLMIVWFFLCLSGLMGNIANTAHAVGALVGIAWGYLAARLATRHRHR